MTNREMLHKIIKDTFGIVLYNSFVIKCNDINCCANRLCSSCPGDHDDFWDKEFVEDKNIQMNNTETEEPNETVALTSREISW